MAGIRFKNEVLESLEVSDSIQELITDLGQYLNRNSLTVSREEAYNELLSFVNKNRESLIAFLNSESTSNYIDYKIRSANRTSQVIIAYMRDLRTDNAKLYQVLSGMVCGSILSSILYLKSGADVDAIKSKAKGTRLYLDSNILFYLLGVDTDVTQGSILHLLDDARNTGYSLFAFNFTATEVKKVLNGFIREESRYHKDVPVDDLYYRMKRAGWTTARVRGMVINLDEVLKSHNVELDTRYEQDLSAYNFHGDRIFDLIAKYKHNQEIPFRNHDTASIYTVQNLRVSSVKRIEEAKHFFLTMDQKLARLNYIDMGHREQGTIAEVIYFPVFADYLWFKNPTSDFPLKSLMAIYSNSLFISGEVWNKFYDVVKQSYTDNRDQRSEISTLLYHGFSERLFKELEFVEEESIDEQFVQQLTQKANKFFSGALNSKLNHQQEELQQQFEQERLDIQAASELATEEKISAKLRERAISVVQRWVLILRISFPTLIAAAVATCVIKFGFDMRETLSLTSIALALAAVGLGSWANLWKGLTDKWVSKRHRAYLKNAGINNYL